MKEQPLPLHPLWPGFNQDSYIKDEIIKLRGKFEIHIAIETGTNYGFTTLELSKMFYYTYSVELLEKYYRHALKYMAKYVDHKNGYKLIQDNSVDFLWDLPKFDEPILFYLDAHWEEYCPLLDEIEQACRLTDNPVIVIHDFFVPGRKDLGFDTYNGQSFTYEWIEPTLSKFYPGEYEYHYNDQAEGAKRGVIYIYPKA